MTMSLNRIVLEILINGSPTHFEPVATVVDLTPGSDGKPTPAHWMDSVLSPLEGQSFVIMQMRLDKIIHAAETSTWAVCKSGGEPVFFDGFIKRLKPNHESGNVRCHFTLNGPLRSTEAPAKP
jgi:hypothetical protein